MTDGRGLDELAAAQLKPKDYAFEVRKLYEALAKNTNIQDLRAVREVIIFQLRLQEQRKLISKRHRKLAIELLPKPPAQKKEKKGKKGRPKGARGDAAYDKRYNLYLDWTREKAFNPSLTQEQFAKGRLGITDAEFEADYGPLHNNVAALLQELKPARMSGLDEDDRKAIVSFPFDITVDELMALEWRAAKQHSPRLTKKRFLQDRFGKWPRDTKRQQHPTLVAMISGGLDQLERGEMLLAKRKPEENDVVWERLEQSEATFSKNRKRRQRRAHK